MCCVASLCCLLVHFCVNVSVNKNIKVSVKVNVKINKAKTYTLEGEVID